MTELHRRKKVEIVTDAASADRVIQLVERLGAKGYTIVPRVSGKGHRGVRQSDDIFDVFRNVLIIVVAKEDVAIRIAEETLKLLKDHPRIVYLTDVDVLRGEHF